jgi:hypothetical protein
MDLHPPADSIRDAGDTFTMSDILNQFLLDYQLNIESQEVSVQEWIHTELCSSGYKQESGRYLTK